MQKKILVTDDAIFMRSALTDILGDKDYAVFEASNGEEAVKVYKEQSPDLVFMDVTMPGMDGVVTTKQIKETHPDAVIVMCASLGLQGLVSEAIRAGAKDFIVRPFQADRVLDCIEKLVG